jgi:hypothetical protein
MRTVASWFRALRIRTAGQALRENEHFRTDCDCWHVLGLL